MCCCPTKHSNRPAKSCAFVRRLSLNVERLLRFSYRTSALSTANDRSWPGTAFGDRRPIAAVEPSSEISIVGLRAPRRIHTIGHQLTFDGSHLGVSNQGEDCLRRRPAFFCGSSSQEVVAFTSGVTEIQFEPGIFDSATLYITSLSSEGSIPLEMYPILFVFPH